MKYLKAHVSVYICLLFAFAVACDPASSPVDVVILDTTSDVEAVDASQDHDTSVDTRPDEVKDTGPDADVGGGEHPPIWDGVTNRCAPVHAPPSAMVWGEEQARTEPVVASVEWVRTSPCEETHELRGVDQVGDQGSMVLAERDGEDAVAVTYELTSAPQWSGNGVKALAWIDPADGTSLGCDAYPDGRGVVITPLHSNPWAPENVVVATTTNQNDFTPDLNDDPPSTIWWGSGWSVGEGRSLPDPPKQSGFIRSQSELLPDGQLLLFSRRDSLISVDSITGALNWVVRPEGIRRLVDAEYDGAIVMSRLSTRFDRDRRVVRTRVARASETLARDLYIEVDACGVASLVEGPSSEDGVWEGVPFGQGVLEVGFDGSTYQARVRDGDETLGELNGCLQLVSLTRDTVGCMRTSRFDAAFELEKLTWPARKSSVRLDESNSPEAEVVVFYHTVALEGGVLMVYATYSSATEGRHRLIFLDWRSGEVLTHVEFTSPPEAVTNEYPGPPIVTPEGMVVFQYGGSLTGISTNTGGLAPTHFPRGTDYGRNGNLGVWNR